MSALGIRLHIKRPVPQIFERFDDAAFDMADDDKMMLLALRTRNVMVFNVDFFIVVINRGQSQFLNSATNSVGL